MESSHLILPKERPNKENKRSKSNPQKHFFVADSKKGTTLRRGGKGGVRGNKAKTGKDKQKQAKTSKINL